jgi:ferrous iron transport protein A
MDPLVQSLAQLHKGSRGVVTAVSECGDANLLMGDVRGSSIARRLLEIGFVPGEAVEVIGEVRPGGDPIAVRIGNTIFALRRREAQPVLVRIEQAGALPA